MKIKRKVIRINIVLICLIGILINSQESMIVQASKKGVAYIATAKSHYKHPVTGVIDDPGNNEGIGQSMTDSVLYSKALIEKTDTSKVYATVRFYLTDNISKVQFATQERGASTWKNVVSTIVQENMGGEYCSDYRFQIPSETAIIKASFYVSAMGRSVIFFIDFSNLKKGSADFITYVEERKKSKSSSLKETAGTSKRNASESKDTKSSGKTYNSSTDKNRTDSTDKRVEDSVTKELEDSKPSSEINPSNNTSETNEELNTSETRESNGRKAGISSSVKNNNSSNVSSGSNNTALELIYKADGLILSDKSLLANVESTVKEHMMEVSQNESQDENTIGKQGGTQIVLSGNQTDNFGQNHNIQQANNLNLNNDSNQNYTNKNENINQKHESNENNTTNKNNTTIPALPWSLVWQCILIITLPSLIVGGILVLLRNLIQKRQE